MFILQDAIKHESYFEPKRKVERGEVDEALKDAEHILEGKPLSATNPTNYLTNLLVS